MTSMVMSSMLSSSFYHAFTDNLYNSLTAPSGSFRTNAGYTTFNTCSFEINYHKPSDPITMNLFSMLKFVYTLLSRNLLFMARQ